MSGKCKTWKYEVWTNSFVCKIIKNLYSNLGLWNFTKPSFYNIFENLLCTSNYNVLIISFSWNSIKCTKRKTCKLKGLIHARSEWTRKFLAHYVQCDVNNSIFHRHNTSFSLSSLRVKNIYVLIQNLFDFPSLATLFINSNYFMLKFLHLKCVEDEEFGIKQFCDLFLVEYSSMSNLLFCLYVML